jgi:hypothetical protein
MNINESQALRYVTYLTDGTLDGCYLQDPPEAHLDRMIVVGEDVAAAWVNYRANEARDGVELAPPADPSEAPPAAPAKVTRRQARQALLLAGLLDDVPAAIANLDDGTPGGNQKMRMAQIEWEDSLEFERARPLVTEIAAAIGLGAEALDQLFITAAAL